VSPMIPVIPVKSMPRRVAAVLTVESVCASPWVTQHWGAPIIYHVSCLLVIKSRNILPVLQDPSVGPPVGMAAARRPKEATMVKKVICIVSFQV